MELKLKKLNKRQDEILSVISENKGVSIFEILENIRKSFGKVSKITVNRDLKKLIELDLILKKGKARGVFYEISPKYNLFQYINPEKYFLTEVDKRTIKQNFNFEIFSVLKSILSANEKKYFLQLNKEYKKNIASITKNLLKKEFERLTIDLSWKSSKIEGNTYSLLETEDLIKREQEPRGHKKEESIMILNHKEALDYIRENKQYFKKISISKIEDIHYLLTRKLGISRGLRKSAVGIVGTKYKPLDNQFQVKEALEETCVLINKEKDPFSRAILLMILISYIQPFEDGNKRTSRLMGNAILMANNICPLSYRSIDEIEYKKAVILFYEQNNINYFKKLFIEQFESAVKNYFQVSEGSPNV
jgi:Fic family protein